MSPEPENHDKDVNWRTLPVRRERQHEALVAKLGQGRPAIFTFLKDIMIFAALVGYSAGERRELSGDTISIILETYSTDEKDGFVYLLGLLENEDANILRDKNLLEPIKVFEEYCNAGLYSIADWLESNPADLDGIDTLLGRIEQELAKWTSSAEEDPLDITIV